MDINQKITEELGVKKWQVDAAVKLIDEGNTIPFIARYRKEAHGTLDDEQLRKLYERLTYLRNLEEKKEQVLASIEEQGKLTPELKAQIVAAETQVLVDDLYRPYRPKRRTRATIAKEKGLEPLAVLISLQNSKEPLEKEAEKYVSEEKGVKNVQEAIDGAKDILAENISDEADYRKRIRDLTFKKGTLVSAAKDEKAESVYEMYYDFTEVVQEWIREDGKRTIMARPINMGGNGWIYSDPLSIKSEYGSSCWNYRGDIYAIWGGLYPKKELLPELKKRGLNRRFPDVNPSKLIRDLLKGGNDTELCLKTGQISMLKHMHKTGFRQLRYKPSFNICNRNHYIIKDASMWEDYMSLLSYFGKDLRNAHYVCPKNLKVAHDRLLKKKTAIEAKLRQERDRIAAIHRREKLMKDITSFYERMKKFFGMKITDGNIVICPLESITQFYQEGKVMHHCVYSNGYYKRSDCLILSAKDTNGKRIETIEVNLKTLDIVQSRAVCNGVSEYHDQIVKLVKKNMNLIRQKMIA